MRIFVSYSRRDVVRTRLVEQDARALRHDVWRDDSLIGGQRWWDEICRNIRECDVFICALSSTALQSRYCKAELEYAVQLQRPIIPVLVAATELALAPASILPTQVVDYTGADRTSAALALAASLSHMAMQPAEALPADVAVPLVPVADLEALGLRIDAVTADPVAQAELVDAIEKEFMAGEDATVQLVQRLLARRDVLLATTKDRLLALAVQATGPRATGADTLQLAHTLLTHARSGRLLPIIGSGLTDASLGSRHTIAKAWATEVEYPMAPHQAEELPQVAQYVSLRQDDAALRARFESDIAGRLRRQLAGKAEPAPKACLDDLVSLTWEHRDRARPDPFDVLAESGCPIYVSAHPLPFLEQALRRAGRDPVGELCRWRAVTDGWPQSFKEREPDYEPSVDRPLVFYVFGRMDVSDSLVLTEDDYFEFLVRLAANRELIPHQVRGALARSPLLMLGFRLDEWDFRCMWRALVDQEGALNSRQNVKRVAAQFELDQSVTSPSGAKEYLTQYFQRLCRPPLEVFWEDAHDLTTAFATASAAG